MNAVHGWEVVHNGETNVRRMAVPGGWLYQVETLENVVSDRADVADYTRTGWHPPVFVPALTEIAIGTGGAS